MAPGRILRCCLTLAPGAAPIVRRLVPPLATLAALACSGSALRPGSAFSDYTDTLLVASSLAPGGASCAMFGHTRVGRCLLTRSAADVQSIVQGALPLKEDATKRTIYGDQSCATIPGFGVPSGPGQFDLLPRATRWLPDGTLPPNTTNVKLNEIVVAPNGTDVCFEFQYPYG